MHVGAKLDVAQGHSVPCLRIIVPRTHADMCRLLTQSLGDENQAQVILDRRSKNRRVHAEDHDGERRRVDRRVRSDAEEELRAGRWIVLLDTAREIDFLEPDARAILFLCCSEHVVPCQACQNTYRLRWVRRPEPGVFSCQRCGADLTPAVVAHVQACRYWASRTLRPSEASTHASAHPPTAEATAG